MKADQPAQALLRDDLLDRRRAGSVADHVEAEAGPAHFLQDFHRANEIIGSFRPFDASDIKEAIMVSRLIGAGRDDIFLPVLHHRPDRLRSPAHLNDHLREHRRYRQGESRPFE